MPKYSTKIIYDGQFKNHCKSLDYYNYEKIQHVIPPVDRIVCVGDLHGDFELTKKLFRDVAKVCDKKFNWIGGKTHIVCNGDTMDDCRPLNKGDCSRPDYMPYAKNDDIKIMEFFYNMHKKAKKKGGSVICLLGNHEINNVIGRLNYVSYQGIVGFKDEINPKTGKKIAEEKNFVGTEYEVGLQVRKYLFSRGKKYAKFLACARQSIVIIGSYLFVHASIVQELAEKFPTYNGIKQINIIIREWLLNLIRTKSTIPKKNITVRDLLLNSNLSPFLPRNLGYLESNLKFDDEICQKEIGVVFKKLNIKGILVGHTPQFTRDDHNQNEHGITLTCKGENGHFVALVDTGSSHAFNPFDSESKHKIARKAQALEIIKNGKNINIITEDGSFDAYTNKKK